MLLCHSMATVPLDEGHRGRRRIGPFWIEEGIGLIIIGGAILAFATILYIMAALSPGP